MSACPHKKESWTQNVVNFHNPRTGYSASRIEFICETCLPEREAVRRLKSFQRRQR